MRHEQIGAKRSRLKRCEPRRRSRKRDIRGGFSLEHLAPENELATFIAIADAVSDHAFATHGGQFRPEIAHLIPLPKKNQIRLRVFVSLFHRPPPSTRRVRL